MSRVSHFSRKQIWVERLNRFSLSRQTVAAFCAAEHCSIASFYQWRRKLKSTRPAAFAELSVVAASRTAASLIPVAPAAPSIHLPNGVRIELGSDEAMVRAIIAQVLRYDLRRSTGIANNSNPNRSNPNRSNPNRSNSNRSNPTNRNPNRSKANGSKAASPC